MFALCTRVRSKHVPCASVRKKYVQNPSSKKKLGATLLQSVTWDELGTAREIKGNSSPLHIIDKGLYKTRHNHINMVINISGVANLVVVCLVHVCTKSHQLKGCGLPT